eukprot:778520-Prymnesium_polylepis.2
MSCPLELRSPRAAADTCHPPPSLLAVAPFDLCPPQPLTPMAASQAHRAVPRLALQQQHHHPQAALQRRLVPGHAHAPAVDGRRAGSVSLQSAWP